MTEVTRAPSQAGPDGALMVVSGAVDVGTGAGTMLRETVGVESATGALSSRRKPAPAAVPATARTSDRGGGGRDGGAATTAPGGPGVHPVEGHQRCRQRRAGRW